jgi:ubiquinone/menaquinone biosynthesis C-methylase UbiE
MAVPPLGRARVSGLEEEVDVIFEANVTDENTSDPTAQEYRRRRIEHWDRVARSMEAQGFGARYYHRRLAEIYRFLIPEGRHVLELGSGTGHLLASVRPSLGVGVDFSEVAIGEARRAHPELRFICADAHEIELDDQFDFVILSDLIHDVWDVETILKRVARLCTPRARVIFNSYSRLWEPPLALAKALGWARPVLRQNWFAVEDVANLLQLTGFEVLRHWPEILLPLNLPPFTALANRCLVKLWPLKHLGLTNFLIARPSVPPPSQPPTVSVVIAARNEAGNIEPIFARTPELGRQTEIIFVEGGSSDRTFETIEAAIAKHPERVAKAFKQTGKGKGDAVRLGFAHASGDILVILDADMTVRPEDLRRFVAALQSGKGEFINGVRLVYPMEDEAMRFFNLLGNKFFGLAFSWLLGQPIKDTLCGTKAMRRNDYQKLAQNRSYFGDFDPFGDFDLLFGAAKLNLKIVDLPVRYRARTYGKTNIRRWSDGWLLLKMMSFAARRLKFV